MGTEVTALSVISGMLMSLLFGWQDNLIFYPNPPNPFTYPNYEAQAFTFQSHDHQLGGWVFENKQAGSNYTLFYFGGNAEDVTGNFSTVKQLGARRTVFVNYRGYGNSEGKPSQEALYQDALTIYDFIVDKYQIKSEQTAVLGRSLGSAVATYLASQRPIDKAILVTPFASMTDMAKSIFPYLPVGWLLQHPFPSDEYAQSIKTPLMMLVAMRDEVIPTSQSVKLFEHWLGEKQMHKLENVGHNDIQIHLDYYELIRGYLSRSD